jgi:hypothetical protein
LKDFLIQWWLKNKNSGARETAKFPTVTPISDDEPHTTAWESLSSLKRTNFWPKSNR